METGVEFTVLIPNPPSSCPFPVFSLFFGCQNGDVLELDMARGKPCWHCESFWNAEERPKLQRSLFANLSVQIAHIIIFCAYPTTQQTAQKSSQTILDDLIASDVGAQDATSVGWAVFTVLMLETIIFALRTKHCLTLGFHFNPAC